MSDTPASEGPSPSPEQELINQRLNSWNEQLRFLQIDGAMWASLNTLLAEKAENDPGYGDVIELAVKLGRQVASELPIKKNSIEADGMVSQPVFDRVVDSVLKKSHSIAHAPRLKDAVDFLEDYWQHGHYLTNTASALRGRRFEDAKFSGLQQ